MTATQPTSESALPASAFLNESVPRYCLIVWLVALVPALSNRSGETASAALYTAFFASSQIIGWWQAFDRSSLGWRVGWAFVSMLIPAFGYTVMKSTGRSFSGISTIESISGSSAFCATFLLSFLGTATTSLMVLLFAKLTGLQIVHSDRSAVNRLSIRDLVVLTGVCAILIAIVVQFVESSYQGLAGNKITAVNSRLKTAWQLVGMAGLVSFCLNTIVCAAITFPLTLFCIRAERPQQRFNVFWKRTVILVMVLMAISAVATKVVYYERGEPSPFVFLPPILALIIAVPIGWSVQSGISFTTNRSKRTSTA